MVRGIATKVVQINRIMQFASVFFFAAMLCARALQWQVLFSVAVAKVMLSALGKVAILPLFIDIRLFYSHRLVFRHTPPSLLALLVNPPPLTLRRSL